MTTATEFIKSSLSMLGVLALGEQVDGEVAADALRILNNMIDSWTLDRLYIVTVQDHTLSVSPGTSSVTIGPGQQIDVARPVKLEDRAFFRFTNLDYPMQQMDLQQYNEITIKSLSTTYPSYYYYDANFPTGTIKFWPVPVQTCELHLPLQVQLQEFADLTTDYAFPPGYNRLITLGLALELAPNYRPVSADLMRNYQAARRAVQRINLRVPNLITPPWVMRGADKRGNGLANFLAGY